MAANVAHRTSLYGLSIELPPDFRDWTNYEFVSQAATLDTLSFASEAVAPDKADAWLLGKARALAGVPNSRVGRIHRFPNLELGIRGFEAEFDGHERKLAFAVISRESGLVTVLGKGRGDFLDEFRFILGNLTKKPTTAATGRHYAVFGLSFHSRAAWRTPEQFLFTSSDQALQLTCTWHAGKPALALPDYRARFVIPPESRLDEKQRTEAQTSGRSNPAERRPAPLFDELRCSAFAVTGTDHVELLYAEGRSELDSRHLHLVFSGQGSIPRAFGAWQGILSSATEEV